MHRDMFCALKIAQLWNRMPIVRFCKHNVYTRSGNKNDNYMRIFRISWLEQQSSFYLKESLSTKIA